MAISVNQVIVATVDVSGLNRLVPEIVAFGRRTMREQAVTSAALICLDAQELTPAASVQQIDADLDAQVTLSRGKPTKSLMTEGEAIVLARLHPNSAYSILTGNRWGITMPDFGSRRDKNALWQAFINQAIARMRASRHSSTNFLQHGWSPAISRMLRDPDYFAGARSRGIKAQSQINGMNTLNAGDLGWAEVVGTEDAVSVTCANAVGENAGASNPTLAAKHRDALIEYGIQPLQAAIENEERVMAAKIQDRLDRGMKQKFTNI